jgi:hypothetical protein
MGKILFFWIIVTICKVGFSHVDPEEVRNAVFKKMGEIGMNQFISIFFCKNSYFRHPNS